MKIENLRVLLQEQTKSTYLVISTVINEMNNEEYDGIPIFNLTDEQLLFVKSYAVIDIPLRENVKFSSGKPYYELYYVAPTLFKIRNENKTPL